MSTAMQPEMDCQELGLKRFRVVAFTGIEELSEAYCFSIDLRSEADTPVDALDLGRSLGKIATLVLKRPTGDERQIVGVITEATHLEMTSRHVQTWRLELRSPLWLSSLGRHYVVHATKTTAEIVKSLLDRQGLTGDLQSTSYQPEHTVQHGESDLDLIQRLLAEEGHVWTTRSANGRAKLFTANNHERMCPDDLTFSGALSRSMTDEDGDDDDEVDGHVLSFQATRRVSFAKVKITGHSPKRYDQASSVETSVPSGGIYTEKSGHRLFPDHHGGARDPEKSIAARKPSNQIAERAVASSHLAHGTSDLHQLGAGRCLKLAGHQDPTCNARWVLTKVQHTFGGPQEGEETYQNAFSCIPFAGPPLRAALRDPPRIAGLRLGVVTNCNLPADGEDEPGTTQDTGLYEVTFPSEESFNGTPFIQRMRLAHPWAGPDRGFHFPLEVDDEVVVSHEHGDPARPFILGCLHNAVNKGPRITTTNGKGTSGVLRSRTGHELRYDEDEGAGKITLMTASQDHCLVLDDGAKSSSLTTKGTYVITAKDNASISTDANLSLSAKGNSSVSADGTGGFTAGGAITVSSSGAEVTISSPTKISLIVGGSSIVIEPAKIVITSAEIGIVGTTKATMDAPVTQVGKAGDTTTVVGATVGLTGDTSVTAGAPAVNVNATGAATVSGTTVDVTGTGAVTIGGASVAING